MNLLMDERLKHRIIGVVVIISLATIFLPAVMKHSNQRLGNMTRVVVQLPPKPVLPHVVVPKELAMMQSVQVATVTIPPVVESPQLKKIAKAEPLSNALLGEKTSYLANNTAITHKPAGDLQHRQEPLIRPTGTLSPSAVKRPVVAVKQKLEPQKTTVALDKLTRAKQVSPQLSATITSFNGYVVRLASFSQQHNAELLVKQLREKGYKAHYNRVSNQQGDVFQVIVGKVDAEKDALQLQKTLAALVQLQGFVVKTGVS